MRKDLTYNKSCVLIFLFNCLFDVSKGAANPKPDELDFAVIRLKETVGSQPIGQTSDPGEAHRGWLVRSSEMQTVSAGDPLFIPGFVILLVWYAIGYFWIRRMIDLKV